MIEIRHNGVESWLNARFARRLSAKLGKRLWERCEGRVMTLVEFVSTALGFGLCVRYMAQAVGAVWAFATAMIRAV